MKQSDEVVGELSEEVVYGEDSVEEKEGGEDTPTALSLWGRASLEKDAGRSVSRSVSSSALNRYWNSSALDMSSTLASEKRLEEHMVDGVVFEAANIAEAAVRL